MGTTEAGRENPIPLTKKKYFGAVYIWEAGRDVFYPGFKNCLYEGGTECIPRQDAYHLGFT